MLLLFFETEVFSALLPWLTSPLFEDGLATVTGALTFSCSLSASLSADWSVLFSLLADWLCSTSWPEPPSFCPPYEQPQELGSLPLVRPMAAAPWFCWFC